MSSAGRDEAWSRSGPARVARELLLCGVFGPLIRAYARAEVIGLESLAEVGGPAVFVANHNSHVDTPLLLASLPARWRRRTLVGAAADYFYATRLLAAAVSLTFGTVPVQRRPGPEASSLTALEALIQDGWSLVMFAEGTRSRDGRLGPLRSGAAALSARRGVPIVPVHIAGTAALMPPGRWWMVRPPGSGTPRRHPVTVRFGAALRVRPGDDLAQVTEHVRQFMQASGSQSATHPPPWSHGCGGPPPAAATGVSATGTGASATATGVSAAATGVSAAATAGAPTEPD